MGAAGDEKAAAVAGSGTPEGDVVDSKDLQQQSKALDKLTDHVEDRQLDSSRIQSVCFWLTQHYLYQKGQGRCEYFHSSLNSCLCFA
jgi:hypothetical protein